MGVDYEVLEDRPYLDADRALVAEEMEHYARAKHEEKQVKQMGRRSRSRP